MNVREGGTLSLLEIIALAWVGSLLSPSRKMSNYSEDSPPG